MSLYSRLRSTGTLSEPSGVPDPLFALPSTVNWMHAIARLVDHYGINATTAKAFYASVSRRNATAHQENTILEQLLFALHQCSALHALRAVPRKSDVARVAIVSWYYGVYAGASAMVAAQDGSFQDDHTGTAGVWDRQIASRGLIMGPFDLRITTLLKKNADAELAALMTVPRFQLAGTAPETPDEALGLHCLSVGKRRLVALENGRRYPGITRFSCFGRVGFPHEACTRNSRQPAVRSQHRVLA